MRSLSFKMLIMASLCPLSTMANEPQILVHHTQQAQLLVKTLAKDLKAELTSAISKGGPVQGLEVCHLRARPIAENIALASEWQIRRTSLKVRNERNTPNEWESTILNQFQLRQAAKEDITTMEYSTLDTVNGQSVFRYMQAIPTSGLCLACHGSNIEGEVSNKIQALYPNDQAIGFSIGDIRGAFVLTKINNIRI